MYPNLSRIDGSMERHAESKEMRDDLEKRASERKKVYKKYSKACSSLNNVMVSLAALAAAESVAGITTSLTVVGLPVGVILTGLGVATGLVSAALSPVVKHLNSKKVKYNAILTDSHGVKVNKDTIKKEVMMEMMSKFKNA